MTTMRTKDLPLESPPIGADSIAVDSTADGTRRVLVSALTDAAVAAALVAADTSATIDSGVDNFTGDLDAWSIATTTGGGVQQAASLAAYGLPGAGMIALYVDATADASVLMRRAATGLVSCAATPLVAEGYVLPAAAGAYTDDEAQWAIGVADDDLLTNTIALFAKWDDGTSTRTHVLRTKLGATVYDDAVTLPTPGPDEVLHVRLEISPTGTLVYAAVNAAALALVGTIVRTLAPAVYCPILWCEKATGGGNRTLLVRRIEWDAAIYTGDPLDAGTPTTTEFFDPRLPMTGAEHSKLAGIEALADVTDAANVAAAGAVMSLTAATDTESGVVELATTAETVTGTDTVRAVTPAGSAAALAAVHVLRPPVRAVTGANVTLAAATDNNIILDSSGASRTVQLPTPASGLRFTITDKTGVFDAYPVSILRAAAEKIAGLAATYVYAVPWGSLTLVSDGTDWYKVGG